MPKSTTPVSRITPMTQVPSTKGTIHAQVDHPSYWAHQELGLHTKGGPNVPSKGCCGLPPVRPLQSPHTFPPGNPPAPCSFWGSGQRVGDGGGEGGNLPLTQCPGMTMGVKPQTQNKCVKPRGQTQATCTTRMGLQ